MYSANSMLQYFISIFLVENISRFCRKVVLLKCDPNDGLISTVVLRKVCTLTSLICGPMQVILRLQGCKSEHLGLLKISLLPLVFSALLCVHTGSPFGDTGGESQNT